MCRWPLKQIEKKRYATESDEELPQPTPERSGTSGRLSRFKKRQRQNGRSQSHQEIQQRRWILRSIQERKERENNILLRRPRLRIAIDINRAENDEERSRGPTNQQQRASSQRCVHLIKRAKCIPNSHHPHPRDQRINH